MKPVTFLALTALAVSPSLAIAQGYSPNNSGGAPNAQVPAPLRNESSTTGAAPYGGMPMESGRSSGAAKVPDGSPSASPSSSETPSGEPPVGLGRGEK